MPQEYFTPRQHHESATQPAPGLVLHLYRVNGKRVHSEPVPLPAEGAVLGSEGLLGERLDSGLHVARNHARIMELCGHWMLSLADEHMVCAVNGRKVPWGELCTLGPGDSVQLGFTELRVERAPREYWDSSPMAVTPTSTRGVTPTATQSRTTALTASATATAVMEDTDSALDLCALLGTYAVPDSNAPPPLPTLSARIGTHGGPETTAVPLDAQSSDPLAALLASSDGERPAEVLADAFTQDATDADAHLSPEEALLQQLDADFATSATSRALYYQPGQALDAILAPPTSPVRVVSLQAQEAQGDTPAAALATSDQDFFAQLARPRPLPEVLAPIITPPNFSRAFTQPLPEPTDAMPSVASMALPETAADMFSDPLLLDDAQASLTLEDILDGPLHIDDVLQALRDEALRASTTGHARQTEQALHAANTGDAVHANDAGWHLDATALDMLETEIPPDPLLLLDNPAAHAAQHMEAAPLPSLSQREHYQTDMHSPYTTLSPRPTAKDTEHS